MTYNMVMGNKNGQMVQSTKAIFNMEKKKDTEY